MKVQRCRILCNYLRVNKWMQVTEKALRILSKLFKDKKNDCTVTKNQSIRASSSQFIYPTVILLSDSHKLSLPAMVWLWPTVIIWKMLMITLNEKSERLKKNCRALWDQLTVFPSLVITLNLISPMSVVVNNNLLLLIRTLKKDKRTCQLLVSIDHKEAHQTKMAITMLKLCATATLVAQTREQQISKNLTNMITVWVSVISIATACINLVALQMNTSFDNKK